MRGICGLLEAETRDAAVVLAVGHSVWVDREGDFLDKEVVRGDNVTDETASSRLVCEGSLEEAIVAPDSVPFGLLGLGINFEADFAVIVFTVRESQALELLRKPLDAKLASFKLRQRITLWVERRAQMLHPVVVEVDVRRADALGDLSASRDGA